MHLPTTFHAWVDESMHVAAGLLERPIYLLAATIAEPTGCDSVREDLRKLVIGRAPKIHWREESDKRQTEIAAVIATHNLLHTVVVGMPLDEKRQERARRQCMERLLHELVDLDVSRIWLESRTPSLNKKDIEMVAAVRSKKLIPDDVRVEFAFPSAEPMLWVPDAVAGAVGAQRKATHTVPHSLLSGMIHEIEIQLR